MNQTHNQSPSSFGLAGIYLAFRLNLLAICLVSVSGGATFYISPSGLDTNSGTSTNAAWRTIDRVNSQVLHAGDLVFFQGGATFNGTVFLGAPEGGSATNPIVFTSYGSQRATINGGNTNGFYAYDCAGVAISNIN